jgi:hypothetical protein
MQAQGNCLGRSSIPEGPQEKSNPLHSPQVPLPPPGLPGPNITCPDDLNSPDFQGIITYLSETSKTGVHPPKTPTTGAPLEETLSMGLHVQDVPRSGTHVEENAMTRNSLQDNSRPRKRSREPEFGFGFEDPGSKELVSFTPPRRRFGNPPRRLALGCGVGVESHGLHKTTPPCCVYVCAGPSQPLHGQVVGGAGGHHVGTGNDSGPALIPEPASNHQDFHFEKTLSLSLSLSLSLYVFLNVCTGPWQPLQGESVGSLEDITGALAMMQDLH